jgi:hypothetical protein
VSASLFESESEDVGAHREQRGGGARACLGNEPTRTSVTERGGAEMAEPKVGPGAKRKVTAAGARRTGKGGHNARAMRAAQVPLDRFGWRRRDDDRLLQQALDPQAPRLGRGMHPAEVAHAMLAGR